MLCSPFIDKSRNKVASRFICDDESFLQEGFVITDEPGCYFIPALIDKWRAEHLHTDFLNFDAIDRFKDFGGIRLEDDILITPEGSRFTGDKRIPITIDEVEAIMNE